MAVMSKEFGRRLCEALDLPKRTTSLTLTFAVDQAVTATVSYYPDQAEVGELVELTKTLRLVDDKPAHKDRVDELVDLAKAEINEMAEKALTKIFGHEYAAAAIRRLPGVSPRWYS